MSNTIPASNEQPQPLGLGSTEGLGPLVERLLKYSDIRRNDPRENREALRGLIVGELADELRSVRTAAREDERERCARICDEARAAIWPYHQPEVLNAACTVCENLANRIRGVGA